MNDTVLSAHTRLHACVVYCKYYWLDFYLPFRSHYWFVRKEEASADR
jgi:hypothetical protein